MRIGNYETGVLEALKDRILPPGSKHPKRAFYWPTDGWIAEPDEIIKAIRLDDGSVKELFDEIDDSIQIRESQLKEGKDI